MTDEQWKKLMEPGALRCWSDCPPGWEQIVRDALDKIAEIDPKWVPDQIKQKFGTLRIYGPGPSSNKAIDAIIGAIITDAMKHADTVCAECGNEYPPEELSERTGRCVKRV